MAAPEVPRFALSTQDDPKLDLARLPFATGTSCNSHGEEHTARFPSNTRTELLDEITIWTDSKDGKSVSWLSGTASLGKYDSADRRSVEGSSEQLLL